MSPNIEKVLLRGFVFGFTAISILALLPLVARDIIQGGPLLYGVLLGAYGVGAIGGALPRRPAARRDRQRMDRAHRLHRLRRLRATIQALSAPPPG